MKTKYPLDWHIVIVTVVVGVLGTVIFGWYFRILSAGAIVAIAYVGGRILWYLKRLEARQEPKDTVADAPADTAAAYVRRWAVLRPAVRRTAHRRT